MKTRIAVLLAAILAVLPWTRAFGLDTHIIENFESYTITGGDDDPTNPGDGNPNNWSLTEPYAQTWYQVQSNGYGGGQALRMANPSNGWTSVDRLFGPTSNETFYLDFKVRFNDSYLNTNGSAAAMVGGPGNYTPVLLYMTPWYGFSAIGGPTYTPHLLMSGIITGDWYQVNIRVDDLAGKYDVAISNLNNSAPAQSAGLTNITFYGTPLPSHFDKFAIQSTASTTFDISVDDINLIPEPSALAMGLAGISVLAGIGRRSIRR